MTPFETQHEILATMLAGDRHDANIMYAFAHMIATPHDAEASWARRVNLATQGIPLSTVWSPEFNAPIVSRRNSLEVLSAMVSGDRRDAAILRRLASSRPEHSRCSRHELLAGLFGLL